MRREDRHGERAARGVPAPERGPAGSRAVYAGPWHSGAMESVVGIVAFVIALAGLLVALGHVGYLAMLNSAARKRGVSGGATSEYVSGRWKVAGGTAGVALLALLLQSGGLTPDILAILLGGGAGIAAKQSLDSTRKQFRGIP